MVSIFNYETEIRTVSFNIIFLKKFGNNYTKIDFEIGSGVVQESEPNYYQFGIGIEIELESCPALVWIEADKCKP